MRSLDFAKKAIQLNPFPPPWYWNDLGNGYLFSGQYEEAIAHYRKCIALIPDFLFSHIFLTFAYMETDRTEEAKTEARDVLRINPNFSTDKFVVGFRPPEVRKRLANALKEAGLP